MSKDGRIWLSHSGIESLNRCPRCFWLQYRKNIRQPEGIVSRLANRFDIVMKNYFNAFRQRNEIPELVKGKLTGKLENPFQEKYFTQINKKFGFWGKLDECLLNESGEYIPVDFKTASTDPRNKETLSAYQAQIDDYIYLLEHTGKKPAGYGYLVYIYPDEGSTLHLGFPMIVHVVQIPGDPKNTIGRINKAIEVLEGPMPMPSPKCVFCNWYLSLRTEINDTMYEKQVISEKKKSRNIKTTPLQQTSFIDFQDS